LVIRKEWMANIGALIRQEYEPALWVVRDYETGGDPEKWAEDEDLVASFRTYGTRIEAVIEYVRDHYKARIKKSKK